MDCAQVPTANPLIRCVEDDAVLNIGEASAVPVAHVRFTHIGSGRQILVDPDVVGSDVTCTMPDLVSGQVYQVDLVAPELNPIPFKPFQITGTTLSFADTYAAVNVAIVKAYDVAGSTYFGADQWLTI